jgi:Lambda phage tail tape-measure protein (Tape_meas_lam_C)
MAEKRVSVRLGVIGGKEVEATFVDLGNRGSAAMQKLGNESEQAFTKVNNASRVGGGGLQNFGFQVQDFAVQVGAGTSASQALAQQLPQLLSGFGLLGVALGTASAILIPIAGYFLSAGEEAETASDKVDRLTDAVGRLQDVNSNFDVSGIDKLIDKYGELDASVMLLMERQRALAESQAMAAAQDVTTGFQAEFEGLFAYLDEYDSRLQQIMQATGATAEEAQGFAAIQESVFFLNEEFGVTIEQAQAIRDALADLNSADGIAAAADAAATLTGLLEDSSLAGSDLVDQLLQAEDALRQLNAEGSGIGGWLGAAIDWAGSLGTRLWDAAAAAAAVRGAQAATPNVAGGRSAGMGGPALDPYGFRAQLKADAATAPAPRSGGGRRSGGGGGGGGARSETNELEKEAERIFKATRTEAEKYAAELAKLEKIKAAGLITNDTYNRQIEALGEQFGAQGNMIDQIRDKLADFAKEAGNIGDDIGDALVNAFDAGADAVAEFVKTGKLDFSSLVTNFIADLARLAAQKFIFGPLAEMFEGFLGGLGGGGGGGLLAGILHEGGIAGSGGGRRTVDPSVFAGARRYHSGGLAGDEVPAILQRGERVLSKQQTRAYERGGAPTIVFNVKDAASVRQSRSQIAADASRALSMGRRGQ